MPGIEFVFISEVNSLNMSLWKRLKKRYKKEGSKAVIARGWRAFLRESPLAPPLRAVLGDAWHEKLAMAPVLGYWPRIRHPHSFNEKIMHRKVYTNDPLFSTVSDKYAVREYVTKKVGDDILNELYHVTDDPSTIPFESLPESFVIKITHGTSFNIIVRNKKKIDTDSIVTRCRNWMAKDFGREQKEYWYRDIEPRIIVENYIEEPNREVPLDYKFWVFNGQVEYIDVDFDRFSNQKIRFFDSEWNPQEFKIGYPLGPAIEAPNDLEEMLEIAETLGEDFEFARVDLYNPEDGKIIFGEITLAPSGGGAPFEPKDMDFILGEHWNMHE